MAALVLGAAPSAWWRPGARRDQLCWRAGGAVGAYRPFADLRRRPVLHRLHPARRIGRPTRPAERPHLLVDLREGLRFAWRVLS